MSETIERRVDELTGLPGHAAFLDDMARETAKVEDAGRFVSLVLVDLDVFSQVNQTYGEDVGDLVIQRLARHLESAFEGVGTVYRYGGDALMVMLPGVEKEQAFLLAERARAGFDREHEIVVGGRTLKLGLTVSIGLSAHPDDSTKDSDIMRKANEAVYRAKVTGRNKVCLAREEKMVTKTSYYKQGQLEGLSRLAKREGLNEAVLLREALDDLLRKYNR